MPKHIEMEFGSIGEMITMLRYNDRLTMADFQRPVRVSLDIDTSALPDGSYLHIAGPIARDWLDIEQNADETVTSVGQPKKGLKTLAKRAIGFRRNDTETETEVMTKKEDGR